MAGKSAVMESNWLQERNDSEVSSLNNHSYLLRIRWTYVTSENRATFKYDSLLDILNPIPEQYILDKEITICIKWTSFHSSIRAEPHSSIGSIADLRTGGRWFYPRLRQYSFRGRMIVIATGFIPLSLLSALSTMVMWESSQWLGKNIVQSTG